MNDENHGTAPGLEEVTLSRDLGLFTVIMIRAGAMIGAGPALLIGIPPERGPYVISCH